ncbi:glycoside hydrolase family 2 protein [Capillimicrobium parvum]|uniref:Beta-glucuronidase n=1 Tax=Capillimicrobium parvum TaxID=2884022 RepID=A0A9E6XZG5_9ACTN|nr:glycoside hydrolase family 2 TIM barrel-domain containing protein [Capillimicrobium parvum]UGS37382.1 Putative beta-glucuronidase [Capillimicrobium parvum]
MKRIAVAVAVALVAVLAPGVSAGVPAGAVPAERALYADGPGGRYLLNSGWSYRDGAGPYRPVRIPNAIRPRDLSDRGFRSGVRWYRDAFTLPPAAGATGWVLRFESVNRRADVWLNGRRLGRHDGAFLAFELPATGIRPGRNELVVRVDGRMSRTALPPAGRPTGWWNSGGILREVYLRRLTTFDARDLRVVATPGSPAPVRVEARAVNTTGAAAPLSYTLDVTGPGGFATTVSGDLGTVAPGASAPIAAALSIPGARVWEPGAPALYEARLTLTGGQETVAHFGVRRWSVEAGRALLNGRPLDLRGASLHEQTAAHGAALTPADRRRLVKELTSLGATFTRAHYPLHPALLEAFDRLGIVVWDQVPVWRLSGRELAGPLRARALGDLDALVRRDRNHASVMAWSVENETLRGGSAEARYLAAAAALVRRLDATRLVAADVPLRPLDAVPGALRGLDAIGINDYVGWYGGSLPGDLLADLRRLRARFPAQALFVTEFGAEANRRGPAARKGTYAFQTRFLRRSLDAFARSGVLGGSLVWALRDFAVRPGWDGGNPRPHPPFNEKGLFRLDGTPKPAVAYVRAAFAATRPAR